MNNLVLFVCGLAVTLMSGMGILVYMVSVGYEKKKTPEVDNNIDLGAHPMTTPNAKFIEPESVVQIPSVS